MSVTVDDRKVDLRVTTLPTQRGEGCTIRILDKAQAMRTLDELGLDGEGRERFELAVRRPHGAVVVTGPTGSGKSTTLYAAMLDLNSVERNITLGPTTTNKLPLLEARKLALDVLREVDLEDKLHAYPSQLSGGQQQRVAIARALAMRPRLMLFDEITSALDPELVGEVVKVLERLANSGMTMVLVTHEMGFARRTADTLVFMHHGRVWEKGPPRELFAAPKTPELESFVRAVLEPND